MTNYFRSERSKAKGYGCGTSGLHHWWAQRVSAVLLIFLGLWACKIILDIVNSGEENIVFILQKPTNLVALILLGVTMFYHAFLGMQMIITDYVHHRSSRVVLQFLVQIYAIFTAATFVVAMIYVITL